MSKYKILISWIIIGRNWMSEINLLIQSFNNQNINENLVELIIIDDFSDDQSIQKLQNIPFQNKQIIQLDKQYGRGTARNRGINIASGKYCLFTNSNIIPNDNFLEKYINLLSQSNIDGTAGIINYASSDQMFENYLNNDKRGLKFFPKDYLLPIKYILFGNCAIKTELLKRVNGFNEKLIGYGGEEIELLDRINKINNLKIVRNDIEVLRVNHPGLDSHCDRLNKFGETNFKLLSYEIQKKVIPPLILKIYKFLPIRIILLKLMIANKICRGKFFLLIKSIMGLSIIRGYKR